MQFNDTAKGPVLARKFALALTKGSFNDAYELLSDNLKKTTTVADLEKSYEEMTA